MARLAYLGTPVSAVEPLRALVAAGHEVALVVTKPDRRRQRRGKAVPTPVKEAALALGLPVSETTEDVLSAGAELGVVVAYGRIIKRPVLGSLPLVNVHYSLLPRWRGAAPVERAILAGDRETGVCLMALEESLDTGPVYSRRAVAIGPGESAPQLTARLTGVACELLVELLGAPSLPDPVPQEGEPTYAEKLTPDDLHIDWEQPAERVHRVVRLGRAWTTWRGRRLLVLEARVRAAPASRMGAPPGTVDGDALVATGGGLLELVTVRAEGRPATSGREWVRGARPAPGEILGK